MADLSITAANVDPADNAILGRGIAAEAITAGQPLYEDTTTKTMKRCDADAAATAVAAGIAVNDAAANQPINWIIEGDLDPGATVTVGTIYCVSNTVGGIQPSADLATGEFVTTLGIGTTTSNIAVQIQISGVAVP